MASQLTTPPEENPKQAKRFGFRTWHPRQQNEAYLFLIPSLVGFGLFVVIPIIGAFVLSFFKWNLIGDPEFVALGNYQELIFRDAVFRKVLSNTLFYAATIVPLQLILGLIAAVALNQGIKGLELYRLIYFMPVVTNIVAVAIVFQWLLNRDFGVANAWVWQLAEATGWSIAPPDWLNSSFWSKPAVVLLTLWKNVGFTMVIYLAGLQSVPESMYDAATVDGASPWQRFRFITIPMVSPTTFFLLVIQLIGAFQLFSEPFVMTGGGPAQSSLSIVMYIYQNAFEFGRMGKATAIAWLLFVIILIFTLIQTRLQRRWVHYES